MLPVEKHEARKTVPGSIDRYGKKQEPSQIQAALAAQKECSGASRATRWELLGRWLLGAYLPSASAANVTRRQAITYSASAVTRQCVTRQPLRG
ncbi:hypothetical protein BHE74_00005154 [Ensete ventricosum]|nr:hypothetical protein BHE74_00005154 [Ensete ventricosum]